MRARTVIASLLAAAAPFAGCNYFDDDLEKLIDDKKNEMDSGTGGGSSDLLESANFCVPADRVPMRDADDQFLEVATAGLRNDFSDLSSCGISRSLTETDGFFRVTLVAGERYHFHVKASPGQDLAVYLLSSCDERTCVGAIDECPAGTDEHFSFVPTDAGEYFLGIDGISDGPTDVPVTFLATRSVCGDGVKQHSEVCDDGNLDSDDGCDDRCRQVLDDGDQETEPNGDRYGANVIDIRADETVTVSGNIGGPCDTDFFLVRVPSGATLTATMLSPAGGACTGSPTPPTRLRIHNANQAVLEEAVGDDAGCPTVSRSNLSAGDYYVTLRTVEAVAAFGYQLEFALTTMVE